MPCGEILILAGDVVPLHQELFKNPFFDFVADHYEQVYWVPGNHEFYHKDLAEFSPSFNISIRSNVSILYNVVVKIEQTDFIFSPLWSKISPQNKVFVEQRVADFDCILNKDRKIKAGDFNRLHNESLSFIQQAVKEAAGQTVVVTHHLPSEKCNAPEHSKSIINEAFCVDLTSYIESSKINFWLYGHSHYNCQPLIIGSTMLLTNQLGYVRLGEHRGFKHNTYFSL